MFSLLISSIKILLRFSAALLDVSVLKHFVLNNDVKHKEHINIQNALFATIFHSNLGFKSCFYMLPCTYVTPVFKNYFITYITIIYRSATYF